MTDEEKRARERAYQAAYRERNREKRREVCRAAHEKNREKYRAQANAYRKANQERIRKRKAAYYASNREEILKSRKMKPTMRDPEATRQQKAAYYQKNKAARRLRGKLYYSANKLVYSKSRERRRARQLGATIGDEKVITRWKKSWRAKSRVLCFWCRGSFSPKACHSDHIMPLSKGGAHSIENLCIACRSCNSSKQAAPLSQWNGRIAEPVLL